MPNETKMNDDNLSEADLRQAAELHLKIADFANGLIESGVAPFVVANAMITLGAGALVKTHGHRHAMYALYRCYEPIREAAMKDAAASSTRQ